MLEGMARLRRIVLVRHGQTEGESSIRFHGSGDVSLSEEGRRQMRVAASARGREPIELVVASPLRRSWEGAWLVGRGAPVRLEPAFREVHFGRWEGLTREEIEARDPILYADWQAGAAGFEYPGGESREGFVDRVVEGVDALLGARARSALLVLHKGVIRTIVENLTGTPTERDEPALGAAITLTRRPDGTWFRGRHSSDGLHDGL